LLDNLHSGLLVIASAAVLSTSCRNAESARINALRKAAERALGNEYYATKEYAKAFNWYQRAAEQGNAIGQFSLSHYVLCRKRSSAAENEWAETSMLK